MEEVIVICAYRHDEDIMLFCKNHHRNGFHLYAHVAIRKVVHRANDPPHRKTLDRTPTAEQQVQAILGAINKYGWVRLVFFYRRSSMTFE